MKNNCLGAIAALCWTSPLMAQELELEKVMPIRAAGTPSVSAAPTSAELKLKPESALKLKSAREQAAKSKHSFEVGVTDALERPKKALCGLKVPKKVNGVAVAKQEKMNDDNFAKLQTQLQAENVQIESRKRETLPNCWWGSAWFTPVKDQKDCGSCWAFAASAAFEHSQRKFYGITTDVSEQNIVDCGKTASGEDAGGCDGGWSDRAFDYLKSYGAPSENVRPYTAQEQTCTKSRKSHYVAHWGQLYPNDNFPTRDEVKAAIKYYGAVVTYMKADLSAFYAYKSGVFNGYANTDPYDVDHAVTLVGWCDRLNAWIIKNSWGTTWGYGGYAYIDYNHCNIGSWVYYAMPRKSSGRLLRPAAMASGKVKPNVATESSTEEESDSPVSTERSPILDGGN